MSESLNTVDFYEVDSKKYDDSRFQNSRGFRINKVQQTILRELSGEFSSKKVLELAVGTGRFTKTMVGCNADLVGVDSSISMLRITKTKCFQFNSGKEPHLVRADATNLPFKSSFFDCVVCINALNHIPKYQNTISESSRVLNCNGVFIFNFPSTASIFLPIALFVNARSTSIVRAVFSKWYTPKQIFSKLFSNHLYVERAVGNVPSGMIPVLINKLFQKSFFRLFAPVLFIKARKNPDTTSLNK